MANIQHITTRLGRWDYGKGPLYKLLATGLRRLLEAGEFETGTPLPPERRLAAALAVSRNTVTAAYAELRQDGWLDARRGSATTVTALRHSPVGAYKANGMFATLLQDHPDVIDLTIAVPDAAPIVADVLGDPARHVSMPQTLWSGHGYHPRGNPALRQSLADILTGNGLPTDTDQLLVTSGAQQAISLVMRALLRPGDIVGVEGGDLSRSPRCPGCSWRSRIGDRHDEQRPRRRVRGAGAAQSVSAAALPGTYLP